MEFEIARNDPDSHGSLANRDVSDVRVIVKVAHRELRRLLERRAEITKRIGTINQTIMGLCNLFGNGELSNDLRELVNGNIGIRGRGITQACRKVLMEARGPLSARCVCEQIQQRTDLPRSKNLVGAVTTALTRLEQYGEARTVPHDNGPRTWIWVSSTESGGFPVNTAINPQE
jgi:hypothetical protein